MGFFSKKQIEGLPQSSEKNIYENTEDKLSAMRKAKKEVGYDRIATQINEKIESGKTEGSYEEDERETRLSALKQEYWELNNRADIRRYIKKAQQLDGANEKITKLKAEIEDSLTDQNSPDEKYEDKIKYLRTQEQVANYANESGNTFSENTVEGFNRMLEIEKEISKLESELKQMYGNQDIKHVDGTYLN